MKEAVHCAEAELHFKTIRGPPQFGRARVVRSSRIPTIRATKQCHTYRKLI